MLRVLIASLVIAAATTAASSATSPSGAPSVSVSSSNVAGTVTDVVVGGAKLLVSHTTAGQRRLSFIDRTGTVSAGPAVPTTAIAVDVCGDDVVFLDERGLVAADGHLLLARAPLLPIADPALLPSSPLCLTADRRERALPVRDGLVVVRVDGDTVVDERVLRFGHHARAYAGSTGRSLRAERAYAAAISVYAPRLLELDVDGDADLDLVVVLERALVVFRRGSDGRLATSGERRDLGALLGVGADVDLRVRRGPKNGAADTVVVVASEGTAPEDSDVVVIAGDAAAPLSRVSGRQRVEGAALVAAGSGVDVVVARVSTNLMALSGVVLSGRVTIDVVRGDSTLVSLPTAADVRAGRIDGALPILDVDLDGDGVVDIVDLGEPGKASLWRGGSSVVRFGAPVVVPRVDRAVADVTHREVVLIGRSGKKGTSITRLRAG